MEPKVPAQPKAKRVAAYARVSSGKDAMLHSLSAQVSYYSDLIQNHPGWLYCGVCADEALTGTKENRAEFQRLRSECRAGNIDLIITKSISRFARNTVVLLQTVRELKSMGVDVYFEEQSIHSMSADGELILTILASYAQEESLSASENQKWRIKKNFEEGMSWSGQVLGYKYVNDVYIVIFALFMAGNTPYLIAKALTADGIHTPAGKSKWGTTTVASILTNEKYKGAALLQKKFTIDFLDKKMKVNEGEVPQYYIAESHQPIIPPDELNRVQAEFARRKGLGHRYSGGSIFASRIVRGDCGTYYGSKVWYSNSKYRRTIWQCNGKFKGEEKCRTPHLLEEDIKARFLAAFNKLLNGRNTLPEDCRVMQSHLTDCSAIYAELEKLRQEIEVVTELTQRCIQENARNVQSQEEYAERYNGYVARYDAAKAKLDALQQKKDQRLVEAENIGGFMFALSERDCELTEFDEGLWLSVVERATAYHDGRLVFTFQNGTEIEG